MTEVLSSWFGRKKSKPSAEPQSSFKSHIKEALPEIDGFICVKKNEADPLFQHKSDYESLYSFVDHSGSMGGAASTVENNGVVTAQQTNEAPPLYPPLPPMPYPLAPVPNWNLNRNSDETGANTQPTTNAGSQDSQGANYFLSNVPFKLSSLLENRALLNDTIQNKDGFLAMKLELINTLEYDFELEREVLRESETLLRSS